MIIFCYWIPNKHVQSSLLTCLLLASQLIVIIGRVQRWWWYNTEPDARLLLLLLLLLDAVVVIELLVRAAVVEEFQRLTSAYAVAVMCDDWAVSSSSTCSCCTTTCHQEWRVHCGRRRCQPLQLLDVSYADLSMTMISWAAATEQRAPTTVILRQSVVLPLLITLRRRLCNSTVYRSSTSRVMSASSFTEFELITRCRP